MVIFFSSTFSTADIGAAAVDSGNHQQQQQEELFFYQQTPVLVVMTLLYLVALVVSVVANIWMLTLCLARRKDNYVTNPYILCLMAADMLWPLVNIPFNLADIWSIHWSSLLLVASNTRPAAAHYDDGSMSFQTAASFVLCDVLPFVQAIFPDAIALTLCLIALERYFAIVHPFLANPLLKQKFSTTAIVLVWLVPLVFNLPILGADHNTNTNNVLTCATAIVADEELFGVQHNSKIDNNKAPSTTVSGGSIVHIYRLLQTIIFVLVLPAIVFPFCYGQIIYKVCTKFMKTATASAVTIDAGRRLAQERRRWNAYFLAVRVQVVHFVCWAPLLVFQLTYQVRYFSTIASNSTSSSSMIDKSEQNLAVSFFKMLTLLAAVNPALNSMLYRSLSQPRSRKRASSSSGRSGGALRTSIGDSVGGLLGVFPSSNRPSTSPRPSSRKSEDAGDVVVGSNNDCDDNNNYPSTSSNPSERLKKLRYSFNGRLSSDIDCYNDVNSKDGSGGGRTTLQRRKTYVAGLLVGVIGGSSHLSTTGRRAAKILQSDDEQNGVDAIAALDPSPLTPPDDYCQSAASTTEICCLSAGDDSSSPATAIATVAVTCHFLFNEQHVEETAV